LKYTGKKIKAESEMVFSNFLGKDSVETLQN
jgi:hypothetical protein